jgi:RND family efflux transporter MFP subunit
MRLAGSLGCDGDIAGGRGEKSGTNVTLCLFGKVVLMASIRRKTLFAIPRFVLSFLFAAAPACFPGCSHRTVGEPSAAKEAADEGSKSGGGVVSVETMSVQRRTIAESVFGLGACEAPLEKSAVLAPATEGQVSEILVKHGEMVTAGQPVVRLNSKLAEANLQEKASTLAGLKSTLQLLKSLPRPEEQKGYRLAVDDARVSLQKAQAAVERLRPLREQGDIPQPQLFEAELAVKQAETTLQKAQSQFNVAMLGPRSEAVDEANAHIASAEAGVVVAQKQLEMQTLRSPIDGVIDQINCKLGQTLAVGAPVAEIVDASRIEVLAWFPAFDAPRVHAGQSAEVRAGDVPGRKNASSAGEPCAGKVIFVGRVVDPQSGSLPVRVSIDNPQYRFAVGETVRVAIIVREKADILAVPPGALNDLGDGPLLNVVRGGKSTVLHPRVGLACKDWVEIEDTDLKSGEAVIVEGGYNLPAGTKIEPKTVTPVEKTDSAESAPGAKP